MNNINSSKLISASWKRLLLLVGLIVVIVGNISPLTAFAGWAWPWQAGELQAEVQRERAAANLSKQRAEASKLEAEKAVRRARHVYQLSFIVALLGAGVIVYLIKHRKIVQTVVRNEIVEKVVKNEIVQKVEIVRSPAHELVPDLVVVDGLNVIYGSLSDQKPSFLHLLGLLMELQKRKCSFKCFFDACTFYKLKESNWDEAVAFRRLCRDFPDLFVVVPGGTQADDYILDYAHSHGTPVITNDRYREYQEKYAWLESDPKRRVSFVVHSGMIQVVPLGIQAVIPSALAAAEDSLRLALGKPAPIKFADCQAPIPTNPPHVNGAEVQRAA